MQSTVVFETKSDIEAVRDAMLGDDRKLTSKVNNDAVWQIQSDAGTITAYKSGKIVMQSNDESWAEQKLCFLREKFGKSEDGEVFIPHIGVDESGKGDYFGPMVIAAVFVESADIRDKLLSIGVRDSKKVSDSSAIRLREEIMNICKGASEVMISPVKYDELYKKFRNVNKLLAWGHARSIENVLEDLPKDTCKLAVIDQFSKYESRVLDALMKNGKQLNIKQKHKGESDIAVAAASIVARGKFLLELQQLREKYGIELPKGANNCVVQVGKAFIKEFGVEKLDNVAKLSFRTTLKITSTFDI